MAEENNFLSKVTSDNKILVIGSVLIDIISNIKALPKTGEDVYVTPVKSEVGGCAINVSDILRQYGVQHDLLSPVGNGPNGQIIKDHLNKYGYKVFIDSNEGDNGWTLCLVEENGERTFMTLSGIEDQWRKEWFQHVDFNDYNYVYATGYSLETTYSTVVLEELEEVSKHLKPEIIFDPSPRIKYFSEENIKRVLDLNPIIHCNKEEIKYLSQHTDPLTGALSIHQKTGKPVIVTLGGEGVLYVNNQKHTHLEVNKTSTVDTIGAGDSHTAGFITGLMEGRSIERACKQGNFVAEQVVKSEGARVNLNIT